MNKTSNIKNNILDSCPFCKGKARINKVTTMFCNHKIDQYYAECSNCGATTDAFNTYFSFVQPGIKEHVLSEKEAIERVIDDWNNHIFNIRTRLSHMTDKEKIVWKIEKLLFIVVHGGMYSTDSLEYIAGWKIRKIAEDKEILKIHSDNPCDLGEASKVLFNDKEVRYIIFEYLEKKHKWNFDIDEIKKRSVYFDQFFEKKESVRPSIRREISSLLKEIGM